MANEKDPFFIKKFLDELYQKYNVKSFIDGDPIQVVHQLSHPKDQEIVALIASTLAFGHRQKAILFIKKVLNHLLPQPYQSIFKFQIKNIKSFKSLAYRFIQGTDLLIFLYRCHRILQEYDSLEQLFMEGFEKKHSIKEAMIFFVNHFRHIPFPKERFLERQRNLKFLLPCPKDGSSCKRFHLFLRWMVRKDCVDMGLWKNVPKSLLYIPVDTHVRKLAVHLGLTQRKQIDWIMCEEITSKLREFDPKDPTKYDFAFLGHGVNHSHHSHQQKPNIPHSI